MFWELIFISMMTFHTSGQSPPYMVSSNDYLYGIHQLVPTFNSKNSFDGPYTISNARITTPVNIKLPSVEQIIYYNYYTAAMNCPYGQRDLSCHYCDKIKGDIKNYIFVDNEIHHTRAIVALSEKRKEIVIAFRATENIWNCVLDYLIMNATPDPGNNIKIHKGFYIAAMSLYNDVVKTVESFRLLKQAYKTYKIVITGHSLGGAMARVTEFYMLYNNQFNGVPIEVYTYGQPRSGNKYYVDYLNSQNITTARITSSGDIVCHLPATTILGTNIISDSYYHVLNEYWINGDKSKIADQFMYEDRNCSNSLGPLYNFIDHGTYFDVTIAYCYPDFLQEFTAIPNVIDTVKDVPPFPKRSELIINNITDFYVRLKSPRFG